MVIIGDYITPYMVSRILSLKKKSIRVIDLTEEGKLLIDAIHGHLGLSPLYNTAPLEIAKFRLRTNIAQLRIVEEVESNNYNIISNADGTITILITASWSPIKLATIHLREIAIGHVASTRERLEKWVYEHTIATSRNVVTV